MAGPWHRATEISENIIYDEIGREVANTGGSNLTTDQEKADHARLIAAAPDMLDALKAILVEAQHHFSGCAPGPWKRMPPNLRAAIDRSRDAIAKAEGRHVTD